MAYGTVNADVIGTSVAGSNLGAGNASIMKNRIINGAMVVNQRGGTVTSSTGGTYGVDRFTNFANGGGVFTAVQSSTVPTGAGFVNSNLLTVTTADSSIASSDYYSYTQYIEGYNTADLQWGTASAKTITLSFWVNSSITGLYAVGLLNSDGTRCYPATYTITTANTWQQITLTVAGCTDGTWNITNGTGIGVRFDLGSGSGNNGTANTWNTGSYVGLRTSSTVNWIATNGATFYITGVQLEVGSSATGFEYVNYQTSLANCQRYYRRNIAGTCGQTYSSSDGIFGVPLTTPMRAIPTAGQQTGAAISVDVVGGSQNASSMFVDSGSSSTNVVKLQIGGLSGRTTYQLIILTTTDTYLSAEL